jgi:general secretion pathway protein J
MRQGLRRRAQGFTLIEVILAMGLLAALLSLLFGAFRFAGQAWEAGEARAVTSSNVRQAQAFVRREIERTFAQRWREQGAQTARIAFEGGAEQLRFLVPHAGARSAGLVAVSIAVQDDSTFAERRKRLVIRREVLDPTATDFDAIDAVEPRLLLDDVASVRFEYYGADTEQDEPAWRDTWEPKQRLPQLVRMTVTMDNSRYVPPPLVVAIQIGEESGCYINAFQRQCAAIR